VIEVATKSKVQDAKILERVKGLRIPPAYQQVRIHKSPKARVQAYGYDAKGRKQFIYHSKFVATQQKKKFDMIVRNHSIFLEIEKDVQQQVQRFDKSFPKHPKEALIYLLLHIMMLCNFRIGNEKYSKENKHYGLTTMEWRHVSFVKHGVKLEFVGKKGVLNISVCSDPLVVKYVRHLYKRRVGARVFSYRDPADPADPHVRHITSYDVNGVLKGYHPEITAKAIRVWHANRLFLQYMSEEKSAKKAVERVALALHNTPAVCKTSYIHPDLLQKHTKTKDKPAKPKHLSKLTEKKSKK